MDDTNQWYVELLRDNPITVYTRIIDEGSDALICKLSGRVVIPWRLFVRIRKFTSLIQERDVLYPFMFETPDRTLVRWVGTSIIIPFNSDAIITICNKVMS